MGRFRSWKVLILIIFLLALSFGGLLFLRGSSEEGGETILSPLLEWQRSFFGRGATVSLRDRREMHQKEEQNQLIEELEVITSTAVGEWGIAVCELDTDEVYRSSKRSASRTHSSAGSVQASRLGLAASLEEYNIDDPRDNKCFGINQDETFEAASVMKVLTACNLIDRVDRGEFALSQELQGKSLYEHMRLMINRSDNDSWYALSSFLGYGKIQEYGQGLGMSKLSTQTNSFSPKDIALVSKKLYNREVANEQLTELLLSFMENTETENRIPAGVPGGVVVYHKSGTFGHLIHDAGVVEHPQNPYILVVMGKGTRGASSASKTIAEISKRVYKFFDKQ